MAPRLTCSVLYWVSAWSAPISRSTGVSQLIPRYDALGSGIGDQWHTSSTL